MSGLTIRHNIWHGCWYISDGGTKLATCHNEAEVEAFLSHRRKTAEEKEAAVQKSLADKADPITGKVECKKSTQRTYNV